jgi:hypothetical protein
MNQWTMIVIRSEYPSELSGNDMMNQITRKYRDAGFPDGFDVYAGKNSCGDHIFVFSPLVLKFATDIISPFSPNPYHGEPPLSLLRRIKL